ncbi:MAG: beta-lactamase induction signal transducer protein [Eubacteriales bacterium]|nr:beta-lactamase induction signal transducer protein [Eubacteriales bacterium]
MQTIIFLVIGIAIGCILSRFIPKKIVGTLRIDHSDPDSGPYLFLEIKHGGMETMRKKKYVLFEVNLKNYIPHK